ncbi:MAG: ATP-binding protein [Candidatus Cloacimonetes bacterium]|nr:ATP-binding protein [Candidatus Cloacimonadota bacterium]
MNTDLIQCLEEYRALSQPEEEGMEECLSGMLSGGHDSRHSRHEEGIKPVADAPTAELDRLVRKLSRHPELRDYRLEASDLAVIAGICGQTRENMSLDFCPGDILGFLPEPPADLKTRFEFLSGLVDRGILSFSYPPDQDFHASPAFVLQSQFRLNGLVWNILLGRSPLKSCAAILNRGFKAGNDPLETVCDALDQLFSHYPELRQENRTANGVYYGKVVNQVLDLAVKKIAALAPAHWLSKFITAHGLDAFWQKCLLLIHFHQNHLNADPVVTSLASLIASDKAEYRQARELLDRHNLLQREGLLEFPEQSIFRNDLSLSDAALSELKDITTGQAFDLAKQISGFAYLDLIEPRQTLDQLILPPLAMGSVEAIISRLKDPRRNELEQWGLLGASLSGDEDVQQGCNVLLHGEPGTGKTYIAGVLANELGRPLLMINANNLRDMYYGSTEKRVRALFREMRLIAREVNPVFLLNEGDQLIHRRGGDLERSADVTENGIQSIFLEELETFPGILLVTSNLAQNLDPAMSRRFHYKLEIPTPDAACRLKLWKLHLPASVPGASELELEFLSQEFPFTGGQIRLVVLNACHEAFNRGPKAKLSLDDLHKYARLELGTSFESRSRVIGFR